MIEQLALNVQQTIRTNGSDIYARFVAAGRPVLLWIDHFQRAEMSSCSSLLDALRSVLAESCACAVMGLARPALGAMRSEIDVALAWLYYCEHPREWRNVNAIGEGYKLKTELLRTFESIDPAFKRRFALLKQRKERREDDPYRLLSAHIHLQSESVLPSLGSLADVVQPQLRMQLVDLQTEVSEYISDLFFAMYANDWVALPEELTFRLRNRMLSEAQYAEFIRNM